MRRSYTLISVAAACIFFLLVGTSFYYQVQDVESERRGCERLDNLRFEVYDILQSATETNRARARATSDPQEKALNLQIARDFEVRARRLVRLTLANAPEGSVTLGPDNSVGVPTSINVDCEGAYPAPLGL